MPIPGVIEGDLDRASNSPLWGRHAPETNRDGTKFSISCRCRRFPSTGIFLHLTMNYLCECQTKASDSNRYSFISLSTAINTCSISLLSPAREGPPHHPAQDRLLLRPLTPFLGQTCTSWWSTAHLGARAHALPRISSRGILRHDLGYRTCTTFPRFTEMCTIKIWAGHMLYLFHKDGACSTRYTLCLTCWV